MPQQGEENNNNDRYKKRVDAIYLNAVHSNPAWNYAQLLTQKGSSNGIATNPLIVDIKGQSKVMYKYLIKNFVSVLGNSEYDFTSRKFLFFNLLLQLSHNYDEIVSDIFYNLNDEGKEVAGDLYFEWLNQDVSLFRVTKCQEEMYALKKQKEPVIIVDELNNEELNSYLQDKKIK